MYFKKRILVTGGAGFIGSHLCDKLVRDGFEVLCLDNFFTGAKSNIAHLLNKPGFELIRHDLVQPIYIEADEIYNLACPASPVHYQYNPVKTVKTSIMGSINMLGLARRLKAKILQASTSEVYGDPDVHPQAESYWGRVNPIGRRACYDEGKRCAETLFSDYHRQNGVRIRIARIFNTYGPRMNPDDGRVVSNFIVSAITKKDIVVYGDGEASRSFCYVDDMVEGLTALMNASDDLSTPVNLGNPEEITIRNLAELVVELTRSASVIRYTEAQEDDPLRRRPDISLAKNALRWEPAIPLAEGLKKTINYFDDLLRGKDT